ncbi:S-adenosyl-L-methionine-dependent methyltransferase [Westerdykella ornata]|uniref:S-adenosyl-L-methionine-dependent methyltransferase n=1 Tax=Westerdykella ornata TaxID=318751 RepID=A0A6A6JYW0_WESOR|nr:S-adenosyl-L-methionine-dependent methyltransferase [Westerdykella ornata]KAF2280229.1 S-adenosyl-L-methionine-dependent methyltransferase [Westerdykella ornata]
MKNALDYIQQLAAGSNRTQRRELMAALHNLAFSLEDAHDTVNRIGYLHLQTAAVKIGFDLGLFRLLVKEEGTLTLSDISQITKADPVFLARYLRYLAAVDVIAEVGPDRYTATNITRNLAQPVAEAGISHCFETIGPEYQALPRYMKKTGYMNPSDEMHTVCQEAWNTKLHQFAWFKDHPENLKFFNDYMAHRREAEVSWLSVYPVLEQTKDWDPAKPVYVNIGGGVGHQCAQFKKKYPDVPGQVILQDLPHTIENALTTPGVENIAHDFFQEQLVKGAKFYFTRGVCHNHPDNKVKLLLRNIMSAMSPESIILLDEWVLPETGVSEYAACMDLTMMAAFAAMERSESQWRKIFDEVGLKLVKIYSYNPENYECVMDLRLP